MTSASDAKVSAAVSAPTAAPSRPSHPKLGSGVRTPVSHRVAEAIIHVLALVAVAAIVLIFVFIAKEALPLFWEPDAQAEIGGLSALVMPRVWPGHIESAFLWQPVGQIPKMNVVPLFFGHAARHGARELREGSPHLEERVPRGRGNGRPGESPALSGGARGVAEAVREAAKIYVRTAVAAWEAPLG